MKRLKIEKYTQKCNIIEVQKTAKKAGLAKTASPKPLSCNQKIFKKITTYYIFTTAFLSCSTSLCIYFCVTVVYLCPSKSAISRLETPALLRFVPKV